MPDLTEEVRHDLAANVTTVAFTGVLDGRTVAGVRETLRKCVAQCPSAVIVDLRAVRVASVLALTVFRSVAGAHALLPAVPLLLCAGSSIRDRPPNSVRGRVFGSLEDAMASVAEMSRTMSRFRLSLAPEPEAPARARECVAHACAQWGVEHVLNEARLVVSELVTNAVKHAGSGIELQLMLRDAFLHVRVRDGSSAPPVMPPESPSSAVGGRGLKLVDLYASGWGSLSGAGGKVVWATLRVRPIGSRESEQRR